MSVKNVRLEVMKTLESKIDGFMDKYLIPVDKIWQPSDLLPDSTQDCFFDRIREIREEAKDLAYDFWVVLVGDTITEEALPTYESWLLDIEGVDQRAEGGKGNAWSRWVRNWTGEENRHGDLLSKYLYLSGRVNMKEVEKSTQYLINDGFDLGTDRDPYRNFLYTSFQEFATNISHKRVGELAKAKGNNVLAKMCQMIAGDEMRHYLAYREFVKSIFEIDPNEMMLAFEDMMRKRIVMPAQFLRESGEKMGDAFRHFSDAAQRLQVYTTMDYVDILRKLNEYWEIDQRSEGLTDEGKRARDYLVTLPKRLAAIAERMRVTEQRHVFSWVSAEGVYI